MGISYWELGNLGLLGLRPRKGQGVATPWLKIVIATPCLKIEMATPCLEAAIQSNFQIALFTMLRFAYNLLN